MKYLMIGFVFLGGLAESEASSPKSKAAIARVPASQGQFFCQGFETQVSHVIYDGEGLAKAMGAVCDSNKPFHFEVSAQDPRQAFFCCIAK